MSIAPLLLVGGTGLIGRETARQLRAAYPDLPLLIGGRDLTKTMRRADELGHAEGVLLDLSAADLGLGERPVSAVAVFFMDEHAAALRFALGRGVPHISISPGLHEIAPEVALYMQRPWAAPVILATEWLVGASTMPTLKAAEAFRHVERIHVGAVIDDQEAVGPAAAADLERQMQTMPAALARREGRYVWRSGDDLKSEFRAADGVTMSASALSPHDVIGLATVLDAPNVQFDVAVGVSSSRRRDEPMSTEIIIELSGEDHAGQPLCRRLAVIHPHGQVPLTGLGVSMLLERALGLDGEPAIGPGLYFPYQVLDAATYQSRFAQAGGKLLAL